MALHRPLTGGDLTAPLAWPLHRAMTLICVEQLNDLEHGR